MSIEFYPIKKCVFSVQIFTMRTSCVQFGNTIKKHIILHILIFFLCLSTRPPSSPQDKKQKIAAIHITADKGFLEILVRLLEANADPNLRSSEGRMVCGICFVFVVLFSQYVAAGIIIFLFLFARFVRLSPMRLECLSRCHYFILFQFRF